MTAPVSAARVGSFLSPPIVLKVVLPSWVCEMGSVPASAYVMSGNLVDTEVALPFREVGGKTAADPIWMGVADARANPLRWRARRK
jgi:hypothetical protein